MKLTVDFESSITSCTSINMLCCTFLGFFFFAASSIRSLAARRHFLPSFLCWFSRNCWCNFWQMILSGCKHDRSVRADNAWRLALREVQKSILRLVSCQHLFFVNLKLQYPCCSVHCLVIWRFTFSFAVVSTIIYIQTRNVYRFIFN